VASDAFGPDLERLRILAVHGCRFVPVQAPNAHIVMARVAGFDKAIYGLPKETFPILFELPDRLSGAVMVSTTKLSQFITARYAPSDAWSAIWQMILRWLQPGRPAHRLSWTPAVRPSYGKDIRLPQDFELDALRCGVEWFFNARTLVNPDSERMYDGVVKQWPDRFGALCGPLERTAGARPA